MSREAGDARDYLADDIDLQGEEWEGEYQAEYSALATHLRELPVSDELCENLTEWLEPFLDDSDRVEGTLYPDGDGMRFLVRHVPPEEPEYRYAHLMMLEACLQNDWTRWQALVARDGDAARWTVEGGRPDVTFARPNDEDPLAD